MLKEDADGQYLLAYQRRNLKYLLKRIQELFQPLVSLGLTLTPREGRLL